MEHYRVDTAITELPSSPEPDETPIRALPRIRGDPKFESTTQSRRISVANPHSIQYNGPQSPPSDEDYQTSSGDDDTVDSHSPSHLNASNEAQHIVEELAHHLSDPATHAADPSVSDLNRDFNLNRDFQHAQNYQPIHQPDDESSSMSDDDVEPAPSDPTQLQVSMIV